MTEGLEIMKTIIGSHQSDDLVQSHAALVNDQSNGILFYNASGGMIAANQQAVHILNTTFHHLRTHHLKHLWENQWLVSDENGNLLPFEKAPFNQPAGQANLSIRFADGGQKWIRIHSSFIGGSASATSALMIVLTDISHRQDQRPDSQYEMSGAFFKQNPCLGWLVDSDGTLHFANPVFYEYFELNEKVSLGKRISELIPERIFQALYRYHEQAFRSGKPVETTRKGKMANGTVIHSYISIFPVQIEGKKLVGGQAQIMSGRDELVEALDLARQRLRYLSRVTNDAIWEWDMKKGTIYRNEALLELIGYKPDHSKGLSWWLRLIHPEDRNRVSDNVKNATERNLQTWQDEYRFKCADGQYKFVQDKGYIVYENGLPVRMIGSLQDVSDVKELGRILADRQREVASSIIRSFEKERNRIGADLHSNVSQVLSSARLYVEMAKSDSGKQKHFLDRGIEYLHLAIDEVRRLSKELNPPQLRESSLSESMGALVNDLRDTGRMQVNFSYDSEVDLVPEEKKIALFRIAQHQFKNIIKHSGAKKVRVALNLAEANIRLAIEDNGQGFDPLKTPSGSGLSNIHERIQFLNGNVEVHASQGNGCRLVVSIPYSN